MRPPPSTVFSGGEYRRSCSSCKRPRQAPVLLGFLAPFNTRLGFWNYNDVLADRPRPREIAPWALAAVSDSPRPSDGHSVSQTHRRLAERARSLLSRIVASNRAGVGDLPNMFESYDSVNEALEFLTDVTPWSARIAQQRNTLIQALLMKRNRCTSFDEISKYYGSTDTGLPSTSPEDVGTVLPVDKLNGWTQLPLHRFSWYGLRIFVLRVLQRSETAARVEEEVERLSNEEDPSAIFREKRKQLRTVSLQYRRVRRTGSRPNVYWRAVDREVLRAHSSWENLPLAGALNIEKARDLRYLRQDCEAWFAARSLVQVNASTAWMALGFGEPFAARRLGLSTSSGMRGHEHALHAFRQMLDPAPYAARRRKEDETDLVKQVYIKFGRLHETSAMLAFLTWENCVFSDHARKCRVGKENGVPNDRRFLDMVRVQEAGLYILEEEDLPDEYNVDYLEVPVIAASPDGIVRRRRGDRFGAWELQGTEVVEVKCRVPFIPLDNGRQWLFRLVEPKPTVPAPHYAQIQFQMLCSGRHIRRAVLVSYAVLSGMTIFEIERNDAWLAMALRVLTDFQKEFVNKNVEPCDDFFADRPEYAAFIELTRDSLQAADLVARVAADEVEACLLPQDASQKKVYRRWRSEIFVRQTHGDFP